MVTEKAIVALFGAVGLIAVAVLLLNWGLDRLREEVNMLKKFVIKQK